MASHYPPSDSHPGPLPIPRPTRRGESEESTADSLDSPVTPHESPSEPVDFVSPPAAPIPPVSQSETIPPVAEVTPDAVIREIPPVAPEPSQSLRPPVAAAPISNTPFASSPIIEPSAEPIDEQAIQFVEPSAIGPATLPDAENHPEPNVLENRSSTSGALDRATLDRATVDSGTLGGPTIDEAVAEIEYPNRASDAIGVPDRDSANADTLVAGNATDGDLTAGEISAERVIELSWPFRVGRFAATSLEWMLGVTTLIFGLAVVSAIPIVQILTLGYLLECSRRIAQTGRFWSGAVGVRKAARIGSLVAGTWLCLLPIQYVSSLWYASNLIDPSSGATALLRGLQIVFTGLIIPHILAAWYCGGKLRHFFWPMVAPFSMGLWALRKAADSQTFRPALNTTLGWLSPRLVEDICRAKPLTDWFLPAVLVKGVWRGHLFSRARDGLWDFVVGLRLPTYFWLGFRGFAGTIAWMFIPSMLLIGISVLPEGLAALSGFLGVMAMSVVLLYVPFAQVHFAHEGRMEAIFDVSGIRRAFRGSPILHTLALLVILAFALPMFLFKIEEIPAELLWAPAVIFLVFGWPARMFVAWAYAKGIRREKKRSMLLTWPSRLVQWPLTLTFTLFLLVSQYISWNGSLSLLENHVVLVPAPFLRLPF